MKRTLLLLATLAAFGCAELRNSRASSNPYDDPFYAKYLNTGSALDAHINRVLAGLRADPGSAPLHNELGSLLVQKGFPKDAEREFERAINIDGDYYQAWYNLGLVRGSRGDESGARRAFRATVHHKPGHAQALFQLALAEERLKHTDRAIDLYAKAYGINPKLLDPGYNPRVLDSELVHLALIRMYPVRHERESLQFQGVANGSARRPVAAPSPEATPQQIIPPAAPPTDPSMQPVPQRPPG